MRGLRLRRSFGLGIGVVAVALTAWGSQAWACSPTARLEVSAGSGVPGSTMRVQGWEFHAGEVDIHLTSQAGQDMSLLKSARGPGFGPVSITVPDVPPGVYLVTGRSRGTSFSAASALEVSAPPATAGPGAPPATAGPGQAPPAETPTSDPGVAQAPQPAPVATGSAGTPVARTGVATPTGAATAVAAPQESSLPAAAVVPAARSTRPAPVGGTTQPAAAGTALPPDAPAAAAPPADTGPAPSPRSATDDFSAGFGGAPGQQLRGVALTDRPGTDGQKGLALGVGMMSAGLVTLAALAGTAVVRRQRSAVARRPRP